MQPRGRNFEAAESVHSPYPRLSRGSVAGARVRP
eukprot:gene15285-21368_t